MRGASFRPPLSGSFTGNKRKGWGRQQLTATPSQGRGARGAQTPAAPGLQMTACPPPGFTCRHRPPGWPGEAARYPQQPTGHGVFTSSELEPRLATLLGGLWSPGTARPPHSSSSTSLLGGTPLTRAPRESRGSLKWNPWPPAPPGGPRAASSQTRSREQDRRCETEDTQSCPDGTQGTSWDSRDHKPAPLPLSPGEKAEGRDSTPSHAKTAAQAAEGSERTRGRRPTQCKDISHSKRKC